MIEHFLPSLVKLNSSLFLKSFLGQGDHLLGCVMGWAGLFITRCRDLKFILKSQAATIIISKSVLPVLLTSLFELLLGLHSNTWISQWSLDQSPWTDCQDIGWTPGEAFEIEIWLLPDPTQVCWWHRWSCSTFPIQSVKILGIIWRKKNSNVKISTLYLNSRVELVDVVKTFDFFHVFADFFHSTKMWQSFFPPSYCIFVIMFWKLLKQIFFAKT